MNQNSAHNTYRPDIDGLRAVAVLSVVVFHAFPSALRGGFAGVDVFFVISGFLISTILFKNLDQGTFSIFDFYIRRIRRIFPALALVLISVLIFGWLCLFPDELNQLGKHTAASAGFIQNFILWKEVGYFDHASETKPLLHIWSLGIEEQFYFIWPLLLWGAAAFVNFLKASSFRRTSYFVVAAIVLIVSLILNLNLVKTDPSQTFYLPQYRFFELAFGGLLGWVALYKPHTLSLLSKNNLIDEEKVRNVLSAVGLFLLLAVFILFNKKIEFPGKNALLPVLATMMIIFAGPTAWINRKFLSSKTLVWFGLISFPLYLWHWPILSFLHVLYSEKPPLELKWLAVALSILLSWLTVKFVERPFRFGDSRTGIKVLGLCSGVFAIAMAGLIVQHKDFSSSHSYKNLSIKRHGFEFTVGQSLYWYEGKDHWLFLGNAHERNVEKLLLATTPSNETLNETEKSFSDLARVGTKFNTQIVLFIGPDKSSVYPEYLPKEFVPSAKRYLSFFSERLEKIENLIFYDPTNLLKTLKQQQGLLYWKSDTHWNNKGAFFAFKAFADSVGVSSPAVDFVQAGTHSGDLIKIGDLKNYALPTDDNWEVVWKEKPSWTEIEIANERNSSFSKPSVVTNLKPLSNKKVWVVGDSFALALRQYMNATFKEVRYVGHWSDKLKDLPAELAKAQNKPDMIIVVRVERSF